MAIKNHDDDVHRIRILKRLQEKQDAEVRHDVGIKVSAIIDENVKRSIITLKAKGEI